MSIELSAGTIITAAAFISGLGVIFGVVAWAIRFVDRQKAQDKEIQAIKEEQTVLVYGVLACLKGLQEQGCDGAVTDAIDKIDKYLNKAAHGQI